MRRALEKLVYSSFLRIQVAAHAWPSSKCGFPSSSLMHLAALPQGWSIPHPACCCFWGLMLLKQVIWGAGECSGSSLRPCRKEELTGRGFISLKEGWKYRDFGVALKLLVLNGRNDPLWISVEGRYFHFPLPPYNPWLFILLSSSKKGSGGRDACTRDGRAVKADGESFGDKNGALLPDVR